MAEKKSCGNCIQCEKWMSDGKEHWSCENYDRGVGMPYDVYPPNDEPCSNWTDDPKEKNAPSDALIWLTTSGTTQTIRRAENDIH